MYLRIYIYFWIGGLPLKEAAALAFRPCDGNRAQEEVGIEL